MTSATGRQSSYGRRPKLTSPTLCTHGTRARREMVIRANNLLRDRLNEDLVELVEEEAPSGGVSDGHAE